MLLFTGAWDPPPSGAGWRSLPGGSWINSFNRESIPRLLRGCSAAAPRMLRGWSAVSIRFDISAPAVNLHNENPSLVALGKLTHTNPRATHEPAKPRTHKPAQPSPPCTICRQAPMPIISGRTQVPSIYYCLQAPMPMISGRTRVPSIYYCL